MSNSLEELPLAPHNGENDSFGCGVILLCTIFSDVIDIDDVPESTRLHLKHFIDSDEVAARLR